MKRFSKLIPAIVLLLVSAIMMSTATYAWFSMNNKVTVTGMEVKTKVSSNLMIAEDTITSTAKKADDLFKAQIPTQTVKGILEPVSTVDGKTFFYTKNADANGAITSGATWVEYTTAAGSSGYADAFSQYYGITTSSATAILPDETGAKPYVEYVFQLKAVNTESSAIDLKLSELELKYTKAASETDENKAFRVAIFVENITSGTATAATGTLKAIFAPSGAVNQTPSSAVKTTSTVDTLPTNETKLAEVAAGATEYYKVVVRLYLEGEDTTCTNTTFAALSGSWALTISVVLGTEEAQVSNLTID